jgi:hypothetical protein
MSAVSSHVAPKPGDVRRRALSDLLDRIDALLDEFDGDPDSTDEAFAFRSASTSAAR